MDLLVAACRELAMAADQAMSLDAAEAESTWTQKRDMLLRISQELLGGLPLLRPGPWEHEVLLQRIGFQFQQHRWLAEPLKKEAPAKKEGPKRLVGPEEKSLATTSRVTAVGIFLVLVALSVGLFLIIRFMFFPGGGGKQAPGRAKRAEPKRGEREKYPAPRSGSPQGMIRPAIAPGDRLLTARAAAADLTESIIAGVPGLGPRWQAVRAPDRRSASERGVCRRVAVLKMSPDPPPGGHPPSGGVVA
jgi:hypothetical protein